MYELLPGVVLSRITPPTLPPQFISRKALLEQLNTPAPQAMFAITPSGFGKTVLAAQWANQHPTKTIWYTASPNDTPKETIFHFICGLRRIFPAAAPWAEKYRTEEFNLTEAVTLFANEIAKIGTEIHMVTDNADNFSKEHIPAMQLWADSSPENICSLTLRQHVPTITYDRAAALNVLKVFGPKELALTENEIQVLANAFSVDYEKYSNELAKVQNWPAGIVMTLKNLKSESPMTNLLLLDSQTVINRTLENLSERNYHVLEHLAYLGELTRERVRLGISDSQSMLDFERLVSEGIFITQIGNDSEVFAMNLLIREAIIQKLKESPERDQHSKLRAAEVLAETGDMFTAITYYGELGEYEKADYLFHRHIRRLMWSCDLTGLSRCAELIEKYWTWAGKSELGLLKAFSAMVSQNPAGVAVAVRELEELGRTDGIENLVAGDLLIMKCRRDLAIGDFKGCIARAMSINLSEVFGPTLRNSKLLFAYRMAAQAAFFSEDINALTEIVERASKIHTQAGEISIHLPAMQALLALGEGKLKDSFGLAQYVLAQNKKVNYEGIFFPFDALYCLAETSREFGNAKEALGYLEPYLAKAEQFYLYPWVVAFQAEIALIEGQEGSAVLALQRIQKQRDRFSSVEFDEQIFQILDQHEIYVRAFVGDFERMNQIIFRANKTSTFVLLDAVLTTHRNIAEAKRKLESFEVKTIRDKQVYAINMIYCNLDRPKSAEPFMKDLVAIAIEHGYRQTFMQQTAKFQEFVMQFAAQNPTIYLEQIARQIREHLEYISNLGKSFESTLTKREVEILNRLSTGIPISQIAINLHISNNTIKTHLKNVYKKLGTDSREGAVARGRELMLF